MSKVYYAVVRKDGSIQGVYPTEWKATWVLSKLRRGGPKFPGATSGCYTHRCVRMSHRIRHSWRTQYHIEEAEVHD